MTKLDIFDQLFSFGWPKPAELVEYANSRHGFTGDDGYYGVTYPSDLDEHQILVEGEFIPEGFVEICYWNNEIKNIQVPEQDYIDKLRAHLVKIGHVELSIQLPHTQHGIPADASGART